LVLDPKKKKLLKNDRQRLMRLDYAILQSEEGRDELARRALEILKSKSDDKTSYETIADALQLQAGHPKKRFLFGHLFLNITNVFCAKKRVGHACICPRMVTGKPVLKLYPPPKVSFPAAKKMKIPHWKLFSWSNLFLKILAFYCLCGESCVTPFSALAMIKGSLPPTSTTPDRLRLWTKTESEDFPGFWVRSLSKKSFFKRSKVSSWSTPQKKPIAGFSWPGGQ